jgi:hypothetical protein
VHLALNECLFNQIVIEYVNFGRATKRLVGLATLVTVIQKYLKSGRAGENTIGSVGE